MTQQQTPEKDHREPAGRCVACGGVTYMGATLFGPVGGSITKPLPQYHANVACLSVAVARAQKGLT